MPCGCWIRRISPIVRAEYEYDEKDLNGMHAAEQTGMPPEQVFKTLVARGERSGLLVFCIPVCCELDLKKAAQAAREKKVELVHVRELLELTGYLRGGCSPVGMKKQFPTYIDETAVLYEEIAGVSRNTRLPDVACTAAAHRLCAYDAGRSHYLKTNEG